MHQVALGKPSKVTCKVTEIYPNYLAIAKKERNNWALSN